jgi:hypothetical protein
MARGRIAYEYFKPLLYIPQNNDLDSLTMAWTRPGPERMLLMIRSSTGYRCL